jgi:hypothetical protein
MVLRKVIEWVVPDDVRAKFGNDGERTLRLDTSRAPTELVVADETNGVEQVRLPENTDLDGTLHAGGVHELVVSALLNFDAEAVLIGTGANRPAAGTADRLYIRTDAAGGPVIERDDGAAWNVVASTAGALGQGGADELNVESLATAESSSKQSVHADGNGGLTFKEAGGVASENSQGYLVKSTAFGDVPLDAYPGGGV